jgi:hypothetical protein
MATAPRHLASGLPIGIQPEQPKRELTLNYTDREAVHPSR